MSEQQTGQSRSLPRLVKPILFVVAPALVLVCGGFYLFIYFNLGGYQYDRAAGVAARISRDIEQLSEQMRQNAPVPSGLISNEEPRSGMGHLSLSDNARQFALVRAEQHYIARLGPDTILEHYDRLFTEWGWSLIPLDSNVGKNGDVGSIRRVYQHPNIDHLLVGLCQLESGISSNMLRYTVFYDFQEHPGKFCPNQICNIVWTYCGGYE